MPLTIPDEWLSQAGLEETEARIEIACRLFAAGKLVFPQAARWAGLDRTAFEEELLRRNLPLVKVTAETLAQDAANLAQWSGK